MFTLFVLIALWITVKIVFRALHWHGRGIRYEPLHTALYRVGWRLRREVTPHVFQELVEKYGTFFGTFWGTTPSLIVADVEIAKEVLVGKFSSFFRRTFEFQSGDPLLDKGLMRLSYEEWKPLRTLTSQCMTSSKMRGMIPKLDRAAKHLVTRLEELVGEDVVMAEHLRGSVFDSLMAIAFGMDVNCGQDPDNLYMYHTRQITEISFPMVFFMLFPSIARWIPFLHYPPRETSEFFTKMSRHVLAEKKKKLDEVIASGNADIMDLHLIAQREDSSGLLSDESLVSHAFLFLIAGLEPTYMTLDLALYYLAIYPEIQDEVYNELSTVLGTKGEIEYEDLQKMKLLEAVVLESCRLLPPGLLVDRIAGEDTELGGIKVDKGTVVFLALSQMHRNPKYFPEPDEFIPERFLDRGSSDLRAFLNFGDGPKSCVGKRVAIMNMQTALANILVKFRFERCSKTTVPLKLRKGLVFEQFLEEPIVVRLLNR